MALRMIAAVLVGGLAATLAGVWFAKATWVRSLLWLLVHVVVLAAGHYLWDVSSAIG